uniref:Peroxin/Ferlin domain-containing protein n=1 Tax=Neobodo designis TaxID=312471 RepID=A0A7S1R3M1_NEODS|mmetsp:Transcript_783/g.2705  ORF Transcript_783/g.2705 Transcript_783/m.2705 type:complete len:193 (+) Transcript_783:29-607(+)
MAHPAPSNEDALGERRGFTVYENQRWYPLRGWSSSLLPTDRDPYSDRSGKQPLKKDGFPLPPGYHWITQWEAEINETDTDGEGWSYAVDFPASYHAKKTATSMVRRRKWQRVAERRRAATHVPLTGTGDDFVDAGGPNATARSDAAPAAPIAHCDSDVPLPVQPDQRVHQDTTAAPDRQFESLLAKFAHEDS